MCVHVCTSLCVCLSVCYSVYCLLCLYFYLHCLNSVTLLTFALLHVSLLRSRTSYSLVLMSLVMTTTSRGSRCCSWQSSMEHSNHLIYSGDVRNYDSMQGFMVSFGGFFTTLVWYLHLLNFAALCATYSIGFKHIALPQYSELGYIHSCPK